MAAAAEPLISAMKKLALGMGVIGTVTTIYLHEKSQENIRNQEYYQRSIELLQGYGPGLKVIGEPVTFRFVNIWKKDFNFVDSSRVKLNIPFTGKHKRGFLVTWASRETENERWTVEKLDLSVGKKQWTFFMNPTSKYIFKPTQELTAEELKQSADIFIEKKAKTESSETSGAKTMEKSQPNEKKQDSEKTSEGEPHANKKAETLSKGGIKNTNKKEDHLEWVK